ncbi:MAG: hypothetical protein ACOZNI_12215 [Myxococcota bacterium]
MLLQWTFATLIAPALAAECEAGVSVGQLESQLLAAEVAYARLDLPAFRDAVATAGDGLKCLAEPVMPTTAARYHRVKGLAAFVARDHGEASRAFAAARMLEPAYRFPDTMVPPNNPLWEHYGLIAIDGGRFTKVPAPGTGRVTFDGLPTRMRSEDWPTIFQLQDGSGAVTDTRWLQPGQPIPRYPVGAEPPAEERPSRGASGNTRARLLVGAGAGAAMSGALFGMSALSRAEFDGGGSERWRDQASVLEWAAIGVGSAAVTTGVFALVGSTW